MGAQLLLELGHTLSQHMLPAVIHPSAGTLWYLHRLHRAFCINFAYHVCLHFFLHAGHFSLSIKSSTSHSSAMVPPISVQGLHVTRFFLFFSASSSAANLNSTQTENSFLHTLHVCDRLLEFRHKVFWPFKSIHIAQQESIPGQLASHLTHSG